MSKIKQVVAKLQTLESHVKDDGLYSDSSINYTITSFEDFYRALFTVFLASTFDSWTNHCYGMMKASNTIISGIYFVSLLVICNFILFNLIMAVIIDSFNQIENQKI